MADRIVPDAYPTIKAGIEAAVAGDRVRIKAGTYNEADGAYPTVSGTAANRIYVEPFGNGPVVWSRSTNGNIAHLGHSQNISYWTFRGLPGTGGSTFTIKANFECGDAGNGYLASYFTFQDLIIRESYGNQGRSGGIWAAYFSNFLIQDCQFIDIRSRVAGSDVGGVAVDFWRGSNAQVLNCIFEDVSSDGIHAGISDSWQVQNILIEDCSGYITHTRDAPWGGTGENFVDLKNVNNITVRHCTAYGYRPTVAGQDASGSNGEAIVVHFPDPGPAAQNVVIEQCELWSNHVHVSVVHGPTNVTIRNCKLRNQTAASTRGSLYTYDNVTNLKVYHNTFAENVTNWRGYNDTLTGDFRDNAIRGGGWSIPGVGQTWTITKGYNAFQDSVPPALLVDGTNVLGDLMLGADLKPNSGSPVIDAGVDVGVTNDFEGTARGVPPDIGAYEFQAPDPPSPTSPLFEMLDPRFVFIESVQFTAPYSLMIQGGRLDELPQLLARLGLAGIGA